MSYDISGIRTLLKDSCYNCESFIKCNNCPFELKWLYRYYEAYTGVQFIEFGINGLYKHHLYYFLYHPELDFVFPELPKIDKLGNSRSSGIQWRWEVHHKDGNHRNDSDNNLELLLFTEHRSIHWTENNPMNIEESKSNRLAIQDELIKEGGHNFQHGSPNSYWDNEEYDESRRLRSTKISNSLIEQGNRGDHYSQTKKFKSLMSEVQSAIVAEGNHPFQDEERMAHTREQSSIYQLECVDDGSHPFLFENANSPNINKKKALISILKNFNDTVTVTRDFMIKCDYKD